MLASPLCERQIKHTAYVSCCQIRIAISAKRLDLSNVTLSLRRDTVIAYKCHQPATAIGTAAKLLPSANYITHGDIFIIVYGCPVLNEAQFLLVRPYLLPWHLVCVKLLLVYKCNLAGESHWLINSDCLQRVDQPTAVHLQLLNTRFR